MSADRPMLAGTRGAPLAGRDEELRLLIEALSDAQRGRSRMVLIAGEPGIGKTRLLAELHARALQDGMRVFTGRAYDSEGLPPYQPLAEALRDYIRTTSTSELRARLAGNAADVSVALPELRGRLPARGDRGAGAGDGGRFRLFEAMTDFLVSIARSSPSGLLLVLDDLHWADRSTLLLLLHLVRRFSAAEAGGILVAGAYRTVDIGRADPLADLLADLNRERLAQRLRLQPLSAEATESLIHELAGVVPAPSMAAAIGRWTEGNPFFLEEVVRQLQGDGVGLDNPLPAGVTFSVPEGVREVIGRRLARLGQETQRFLQIGATLGDGFHFEVAAQTSGAEFGALVDALEEALAAGVLREDGGGYSFAHALIRQTISAELSRPRRALLHLRCAEAIERVHAANLAPHWGELAHHLVECGTDPERNRARQYALRAAEQAVASLAYEQAADYYRLALEADVPRGHAGARLRCELLLGLGDVQRRAGDLRAAIETYQRAAEEARGLGDAALLAEAALGFEEALLPTGMPRFGPSDSSVLIQEEALRALPPEDSPLRARVLAALGRASYFAGLQERGRALTAEGVAMARRAGDAGALAYALNARRMAVWGLEDPEGRLAVVGELIEQAEAIGDRELELDGRGWQLRALFELGDVPALDHGLSAYQALAEELREQQYLAEVERWRATRAAMLGQFAVAAEAADRALALSEPVQGEEAVRFRTAQMFHIQRYIGDRERLSDLAQVIARIAEQVSWLPAWHALLSEAHLTLGRSEQAQRELALLALDGFEGIARDWLWLFSLTRLALVCSATGDAAHAPALYRLLRPYGSRYVTESCPHGSVARYLGMLAATMGRWSEALQEFERAMELDRVFGSRPEEALTWHAFGHALLSRSHAPDRERGRTLLQRALAVYAELGMHAFAAEASALLEAPGTRRQRADGAVPPDGLTEREIEILRLIAAGHDNETIAAELVLSVRTVERHISNLYSKIGARGRVARAAAVGYAVAHGLATQA